jgi:MFS family permease
VEQASSSTTARSALVRLLAAEGISRAGNVVTAIAVPWFVLETTGSAARAGVAGFAAAAPVVFSLLFGGTLVDRLGYRRVSIVADQASGLCVALIPLLHATVGLTFGALLALIFLGALLDVPASLARMSLLPDLARASGMRIERAYAFNETGGLLAGLLGPALTGALIVAYGAPAALWIDAASFAVSAMLMTGVRTPASAEQSNAPDEPSSYRAQLIAGLRFVMHDPFLRALVGMFAVMNLLLGPIDSVILPVYARTVFGSAFDFGLLAAASGAGAIGAAVLYGAIGHRLSRRGVFLGGYLAVPLALAALVTEPALAVAVALVACIGFAVGIIDPLEYTIYFERVPERMRARALGVIGALGWCSVPVGRVLCGAMLGRWGVPTTLSILALVFGALPLVMLSRPSLQNLGPPSAELQATP